MNNYKIYPKQFRNDKIPVEKNRCFFIMPFAEDFDIVYGEIKDSLSKDHYICTRVDEISGSTPIMSKILTEILKAQFIIVDLTNCNPNVFYELGVAHTFKDAQNIFLLKQKDTKVPFDILHLTYMEYEPRNLKHLTARLKRSLKENSYISDFYEALNVHGIIDYVHDNQDEFIEILKELLEKDIGVATDILNYNSQLSEPDVENFLNRITIKIKNLITHTKSDILNGVFDFYAELLLACYKYRFVGEFVSEFLTDFFGNHKLTENDILSYKIDFAVKFAKSHKLISIVMPWIIAYFKRSKSASVDINRYKLESFLLTTESREINEVICNTMTDKDSHVREHFADIIGEKKLIEANDILCKQLLSETNYYTAVSMIEALGKLGVESSVEYINMWLEKHCADIVATKHTFVFAHARIAAEVFGATELEKFDNKYKKYL